MQILFTRWCLDPAGRTPVAVEPKRVDCLEYFHPAGGEVAAGTRIIMKGKQEYIVQGTVEEVSTQLNPAEGAWIRLTKAEIATAAIVLHKHAMTDGAELLAEKFAAELKRRDPIEFIHLLKGGYVYPVDEAA